MFRKKNIKFWKPFEPYLGHLKPKIFSVGQPWWPTFFRDLTPLPLPPTPSTILMPLPLWFYKPIKRHPNNINWSSYSVVNFEHVSWGIFKSNHSEKLWKMTLLKHLNFQGNMWRIPSKHFLFSRRLEDVFSVTLFVFQDVLKDKKMSHWRRLEEVFKTSSVRLHQDEYLLGFLKLYEKIFQQRSHSSSQMHKISP